MTFADASDARTMGLFWTLELESLLPPAVVPAISATLRQADSEDVAELASAMGFGGPEPVLARFARGCQCAIARTNGRLVGYGWITFDEERIGSLGLSVRLQRREAYIWDCATLVDFRGQRLYPALLSHMLRELQAAGFKRVWIGMDADNLSSQAGVARAGFKPIVALLQARHTPTRTLLVRGYPGVSQQEVQDAQYVLLGQREASSITLPLPPL